METDSEAMEAAHLQAVGQLPQMKHRFLTGLKPGETLIVKHGFPTREDQQEFMWLAVNTWKGDRLQSQLMNNPHTRLDLRAGQTIEIREVEVFDWALLSRDGEMEGGYTDQIALRDGASG